ncbi:MAG: hypothetical protein ACI4U3_02720 [Traorella sp.]
MKKKNLLVLLLLIYNQVAFILYCILNHFDRISILMFIINFICNNTMIIMYHKQNNKREIAQEIKKIEMQVAEEQIYYQKLEQKRIEISKIHHDYNNHISTIIGLLHSGKEEEAKSFLSDVIEKINHSND